MGVPSGAPGLHLGEGKTKEMERTETSQNVLTAPPSTGKCRSDSSVRRGTHPATAASMLHVSLAGARLEVPSCFPGLGSTQFPLQLLEELFVLVAYRAMRQPRSVDILTQIASLRSSFSMKHCISTRVS